MLSIQSERGSALLIVLGAILVVGVISASMISGSINLLQESRTENTQSKLNQRLLAGLEVARQDLVNTVQSIVDNSSCQFVNQPDDPAAAFSLQNCEEIQNYQSSISRFSGSVDRFQVDCISAGVTAQYGPDACQSDRLPQSWRISYSTVQGEGRAQVAGQISADVIIERERLRDYSLLVSNSTDITAVFGGSSSFSGKVGVYFDDPNSEEPRREVAFRSADGLVFNELFVTNLPSADHLVEGNPDEGFNEADITFRKGVLTAASSVHNDIVQNFEDLARHADYTTGERNYQTASFQTQMTGSETCEIRASAQRQYISCGDPQWVCPDGEGGQSAPGDQQADTSSILGRLAFEGCRYETPDCEQTTQTDYIIGDENSFQAFDAGEKPVIFLDAAKTRLTDANGSASMAACTGFTLISSGDNELLNSVFNPSLDYASKSSEHPAAIVSLSGSNKITDDSRMLIPGNPSFQDVAYGDAMEPLDSQTSFAVQASLVSGEKAGISIEERFMNDEYSSQTLGTLSLTGSLIGAELPKVKAIDSDTGNVILGLAGIRSNYDAGLAQNAPSGFNEASGGGLTATVMNISLRESSIDRAISYFDSDLEEPEDHVDN